MIWVGRNLALLMIVMFLFVTRVHENKSFVRCHFINLFRLLFRPALLINAIEKLFDFTLYSIFNVLVYVDFWWNQSKIGEPEYSRFFISLINCNNQILIFQVFAVLNFSCRISPLIWDEIIWVIE